MQFRHGRSYYELDFETVINAANQATPDAIDGRHKYYVNVEGRRFPPKQLFSLATGIPKGDFISLEANRRLRKLGFTIEEFGHSSRPAISSYSPETLQEYADRETENSVTFAVSLEPDEDGYIVASCPQLPGCHSQGRSKQEAVKNIAEAIRGYIASMKRHGETVPAVEWELVKVDL